VRRNLARQALAAPRFTAVFTFVEKKEGVFLNFGSTAVSFLLVSLAID
jgi:hypothetical protein